MSQHSSFTSRALDASPHAADPLAVPSRLAAIDRLRLLEADQDEVLDRASRLASRLLASSISLVTIVTDDAQHFVGATSDDGTFEEQRRTPLSHSFCQHVVRSDAPFVVDDATRHPLVQDNLAIPDLGVVAYLGVPIRDADGQVLGSFCVIDRQERTWTEDDRQAMLDLAEFVRAELLLRDQLVREHRSWRSRDDLLRTVAHDLRAAVTAVVGSLQTLETQGDVDAAGRHRLIDIAMRQGDRIQQMMDRLLDEPGNAGLERTQVEIGEVARAAVDAASAALGQRDRVELDVEPARISTHVPSLERVLINLVRNALQHTDGAVRVAGERDREQVVLTVADEGPGLPDWLLRTDLADASLRGRAAGHGIGLFSALSLVRALGGEMTVDTGPTGTRLIVTLPA